MKASDDGGESFVVETPRVARQGARVEERAASSHSSQVSAALEDDYWPPTSYEQWEAFRHDLKNIVQNHMRRQSPQGGLAGAICRDAVDVDDMVQDLALYFFKRIDSPKLRFRTLHDFESYMRKVVPQKLANLARKEKRFRELCDHVGKAPQEAHRDREVVLKELLGLIDDDRAREIFRLRFGLGLTVTEIAARLQLSKATISNISSKTKTRLEKSKGRE